VNWYFAISAASLDRADHDWRGLIASAIASAKQRTRLKPHMLYDGEPSAFTDDIRALGVTVIHHRVSFYDELVAFSLARRYPDWLSIAAGAFLRTEIPLIEHDEDYVLYTDCDVMFLRDVPRLQCRSAPFAVAPETNPLTRRNINSGVMVMNLPALRRDWPQFRQFMIDNFEDLISFDQTAYEKFYAKRWRRLSPSYNWRPYWGYYPWAHVVHWHGPKPTLVRRLLNGDTTPVEIWDRFFRRAPRSYARYLATWDDFQAGAAGFQPSADVR